MGPGSPWGLIRTWTEAAVYRGHAGTSLAQYSCNFALLLRKYRCRFGLEIAYSGGPWHGVGNYSTILKIKTLAVPFGFKRSRDEQSDISTQGRTGCKFVNVLMMRTSVWLSWFLGCPLRFFAFRLSPESCLCCWLFHVPCGNMSQPRFHSTFLFFVCQ